MIGRWPQLALITILVALATSVLRAPDVKDTVESKTDHVVEIRDFAFSSTELVVVVGESITWVNQDIVPHTATAMNGSWSSDMLKQGESFSVIVTETMQLSYYCKYHPMMKANIQLTNSVNRLIK